MPRCRVRPFTAVHGPSCGFTLIEVLIAVTIFGIISGMSYRVLTTILESRERIERETKRWRDIALALGRLQQDIQALLDRTARDKGDALLAPIVGRQVALRYEGQIEMTRIGAIDLPGALGAPQRVGYRLEDGHLQYLAWPVLDRAPLTEPRVIPLLDGVAKLEIRYADAGGAWQTAWPRPGASASATSAPTLIEIVLTLESGEGIRRVIPTAWGQRL